MGLGRKKAENGRDTIELQVSEANSISKCNVVALGLRGPSFLENALRNRLRLFDKSS